MLKEKRARSEALDRVAEFCNLDPQIQKEVMGMRLPAYNAPAKKSIEISLPWHSFTIPIADMNHDIVRGKLNKSLKPQIPAKPWSPKDFFGGSGYYTQAPRRPSTNCMYDDRWLRFSRWAAGQGFDPLDPTTAAQIASFLFTLFDTHGLSPQTVKGYRTCLGSVLARPLVLHKTISDMIASMELQRPRVTPVLPQWDLGIVLEAQL